MAVLREQNWLGNQRVDIPHLRSQESAVRADFDLLAGAMLAGKNPLVVSGFYVISTGITIATNLKIRVADGSLIHFLASESGSIFHVPADRADEQLSTTNPRILGSFTPGTVNYIGLDFIREADDSTIDLVEFIDSDSELETPVQVPLARTADYRIIISTLDFENNPGVCPIAKVTLDDDNNISDLIDSRNGAFRLGTGGTLPNIKNSFPWPSGRAENLTGDTFVGGDKSIQSFKDWMDGVMSRIWEIGGGEYWYSPTTPMNERLARQGLPFVSNGEYFEWDGTNLHWKGLVWIFANSTGVYNVVSDQITDDVGLTDLVDGDCIYVDVDRTQDTTVNAVKGTLTDLGSPEVPGSRYVLAWCRDIDGAGDLQIFTRDQSYMVNSSFIIATTAALGTVRLSATVNANPQVASVRDSSPYPAFAGGLTRTGDFFGGAGDIQIGGFGVEDHAVTIYGSRDQDEVSVRGTHDYGLSQCASFVVYNGSNFVTNVDDLTARFTAWNNSNSRYEDAHHVESGGAIGWRNVLATPLAASPTGLRPIRSKTFFQTNGLSSPDTRDQFCIVWFDGNVTVIAESNSY